MSVVNVLTKKYAESKLQDKLIAGDNITITTDNVISSSAGAGVWYQHNPGSHVYIGPGYGDTPVENNFVMGSKNGSAYATISLRSNDAEIKTPQGNIKLEAGSSIYIGPEMRHPR